MLHSVILGIVQGLTEFLPVSSSGHLALFQMVMGWSGSPLLFDVVLHFATMLATIIYFRRDICELFMGWFSGLFGRGTKTGNEWVYGWAILSGTFVTMIVALLLKPLMDKWLTSGILVGLSLLFTALVLWYASKLSPGEERVTVKKGTLIGLAQGVAVIPGISRSGVTIVSGLKTGFPPAEAFRFSFLLSLPAILGANLLEFLDVWKSGGSLSASMPAGWGAGVLAAFVSGFFALALLRKIVTLGRWKVFSVYCAVIGMISILTGL